MFGLAVYFAMHMGFCPITSYGLTREGDGRIFVTGKAKDSNRDDLTGHQLEILAKQDALNILMNHFRERGSTYETNGIRQVSYCHSNGESYVTIETSKKLKRLSKSLSKKLVKSFHGYPGEGP
jgi:hypothetical protein